MAYRDIEHTSTRSINLYSGGAAGGEGLGHHADDADHCKTAVLELLQLERVFLLLSLAVYSAHAHGVEAEVAYA
jgi:hypothetical protein